MRWVRPFAMLWYAAFRLASRRLWASRTLVAGVTVGFMIAVGAASSLPVFSAGALQRLLAAQIQASGHRELTPVHLAHFEQARRPTTREQYLAADLMIREEGLGYIGLPAARFVRYGALLPTRLSPVDRDRVNPLVERWMSLAFLDGLPERIELVAGRLPAPGAGPEGGYEAIVEEEALDAQEFSVGTRFWVPLSRAEGAARVQVTVVGSFRRADPADPFWFQGGPYEQQLFLAEEAFVDGILRQPQVAPGQFSWYWGVESGAIRVVDAIRLLAGLYNLEARAAQLIPDTELFEGPMELLTQFASQAIHLQGMLFLLTMPALAVLAYFVAVTSAMIVANQRQEIAVLRSRGAGLWQVALVYLSEGLLLALLGLAGGYPLGILLARVMGAAAGFLQFVDRVQPPLMLPTAFWLYGLGAALLGVVAYLGPALVAARSTIVTYKQENARQLRPPLWARWGLDLVSLALAGYGYYTLAQGAPAQGGSLGLEPLQVIAPALFLAGAGLLLLRTIPRAAGIAFRLTERWAPASAYLAVTQLSRSSGSYAPVVLLLTLTLGMGLYNAAVGRTLERNMADQIRYEGGADAILEEAWGYLEEPDPTSPTGSRLVAVVPPPWELHHGLPGVLRAARVRAEPVTPAIGGRSQRKGQLLAIEPGDFSQVAWFRSDLAKGHLNLYLGLLHADEEAVLVSRPFLARHSLQPGDRIALTSEGGAELSAVIFGALDYFPSRYPADGDFFIANLAYVEQSLGLRPYQVWLKLAPTAGIQPVVDALQTAGIETIRADDHRQRLIQARRDPMMNGLLGGLTNSFLAAAAVTVVGFLLYTALSVRSRALQFGLLRAMGLTAGQTIAWVALEQVLVVALGALLGTGLGRAASLLFIPFLEAGGGERRLPFLIADEPGDRLRLYLVLLLMLLVGLAGLVSAIRRMRIQEAVKLGEDH